MNIKKQFLKYMSLNVCGMIGISLYILADSFFISVAQGADGLTALNLVLPIYNLIFAIGSMIGVGSAIRYAIGRAKKDKDADTYLFNALAFTGIMGFLFMVLGFFFPEEILSLLGADERILSVGVPYTRVFMSFSPIFMWNYIANAYVRNDGAPTTAMMATLFSSLFNIVFDYILMFPFGLGMVGAAWATALSPVLGIAICMTHFFSKRNHIVVQIQRLSVKRLIQSCQVGVSAFVGEMSSGIITMTFNFLILSLAGNVGVAAYGIVANIALVAVAVFNGIAQGGQPLMSDSYGKGRQEEVKSLLRMSLVSAVVFATLIYGLIFLFTSPIVAIFNSEESAELAKYAFIGMRIYFFGIFFSSINIVGSSYFSAIERAKEAFLISILRGFVLILFFAFLLAALLQMIGVWSAYVMAEFVTCILCVIFIKKGKGITC